MGLGVQSLGVEGFGGGELKVERFGVQGFRAGVLEFEVKALLTSLRL